MITDEQLKEAGRELDGALLNSLPERGDLEFSPAFERKMKKLIYRKKHPVMSHPVFRAAAILLVMLLLGGTVLLAVPDARASFDGLFFEEKDGDYRYVLTGYVDADDLRTYHLGWIPEGYLVTEENHEDNKGMVIYRNPEAGGFTFLYFIKREGDDAQLSALFKNVEYRYKETTVNGRRADLFELRYSNGKRSYVVIWMNEEQSILFEIHGAQTETEAVKMAENVVAREPEE